MLFDLFGKKNKTSAAERAGRISIYSDAQSVGQNTVPVSAEAAKDGGVYAAQLLEKGNDMWNRMSARGKEAAEKYAKASDDGEKDNWINVINQNADDIFFLGAAGMWYLRAALYGSGMAKEKIRDFPLLRINSLIPLSVMFPGTHSSCTADFAKLQRAGLGSFPASGSFSVSSINKDGLIICEKWVGTDGPDEDGFGMEELYDFYVYDEYFNLLGSAKSWSTRDFNNSWKEKEMKEKRVVMKEHMPAGTRSVFDMKDGLIFGDTYAVHPDKNVQKVVIPDGVRVIGSDAFRMCTKLKEVVLPDSVEIIESMAFDFCKTLAKINLPKGLKEIHGAFSYCASLRQITIPDTVTYIGGAAFYATGLESVVIPDSVKTLGKSAFKYSQLLKSAVIGKGVEVIESETFKKCESLAEIKIPENVKHIGAEAFYDCKSLEKVEFSEGLETIGNQAFNNCDEIKGVIELPSTLRDFGMLIFGFKEKIEGFKIENNERYMSQNGNIYDKTRNNMAVLSVK